MAVSTGYAHSPTSVAVTTTETTATITWVHAAAWSGTINGITDVDIVRVPGQVGSTNYTTLVGNSTQYVVANNATGLATWTDHSLPQGTVFSYEVCHGDPNTHTCAVADTNATNGGGVDPVYVTTKTTAVTGVNISAEQNSAVLTWGGLTSNNTGVAGYKIEYSADGGSTFTTSTTNSSSTTRSYEVTGLQTSLEYVFRVS